MKFICLGYYDLNEFSAKPQAEREALQDACIEYDGTLRSNNHFAGGEALQPADTAVTLRWKDGKATVTDGPYAETKEQIGGILILEARDLNHAIDIMSKHPGVQIGPFEIRPAADLAEIVEVSEQRTAAKSGAK